MCARDCQPSFHVVPSLQGPPDLDWWWPERARWVQAWSLYFLWSVRPAARRLAALSAHSAVQEGGESTPKEGKAPAVEEPLLRGEFLLVLAVVFLPQGLPGWGQAGKGSRALGEGVKVKGSTKRVSGVSMKALGGLIPG